MTVKPVKIYGMQMSPCNRRCMAVCEEKGIPYEIVPVNLFKGETKKSEYLELHPFGKVPALQDGDLEIFESRAICRYLAKAYTTGTDLLPSDPKALAVVDNWMEVEANYYHPHARLIVFQILFAEMRGVKRDQAAVEKAMEELKKVLDVYEARLSKQPYLAGNDFTMADLFHLPYTHYMVVEAGQGHLFDPYPSVKAWWEKCSTRPAWQKIAARGLAEDE